MNKNKIITIVVAIIIFVGLIVSLTAKFNVDLMTKAHKQIQLDLKKEFNVADLKEITNEVFKGQQVEIQKVEVYKKRALISTDQITDEQKTDLVLKVNDKFGTQIDSLETEIISVPRTKLSSIVTKYIGTFVITTILIAIYMIIRFRKLGALKVLVKTLLGIIILEALVMSIIAIVRIPVGANLPSIVFITYVIATLALTDMNEKELKKISEEEAKKKKK